MPKRREFLGGADLHPENKTPPDRLAAAWGVGWRELPEDHIGAPPDGGNVLSIDDDPHGHGHGTGPADLPVVLAEWARDAALVVIIAGPGSSFFNHICIAHAMWRAAGVILIATNDKHHAAWSAFIRRHAPQALVIEHDTKRDFRVTNDPGTTPTRRSAAEILDEWGVPA
jgi:hypothetical protein